MKEVKGVWVLYTDGTRQERKESRVFGCGQGITK